ncbi:MAG: hypothetical protein WC712_09455 [Candidatus Brocadiia bacterium]
MQITELPESVIDYLDYSRGPDWREIFKTPDCKRSVVKRTDHDDDLSRTFLLSCGHTKREFVRGPVGAELWCDVCEQLTAKRIERLYVSEALA